VTTTLLFRRGPVTETLVTTSLAVACARDAFAGDEILAGEDGELLAHAEPLGEAVVWRFTRAGVAALARDPSTVRAIGGRP
jgi:hypothetical protein